MHPFLFTLLAVFTPFLLLAVLLLPPYVGIYLASYLVYDTGATSHPLAGKWADPFYIINVFSNVFSYWKAHISEVDILHYTVPVTALPLAGILASFWLTRKLVRVLGELFHMGVKSGD